MATITEEQVIEQLKQVFDPEMPVDIWNFGLVYAIEVTEADDVQIRMTLTSESCPSAKAIPDDVVKKVELLEGVNSCRVEVVWEPRWSPERITPEGKRTLGLDENE